MYKKMKDKKQKGIKENEKDRNIGGYKIEKLLVDKVQEKYRRYQLNMTDIKKKRGNPSVI